MKRKREKEKESKRRWLCVLLESFVRKDHPGDSIRKVLGRIEIWDDLKITHEISNWNAYLKNGPNISLVGDHFNRS